MFIDCIEYLHGANENVLSDLSHCGEITKQEHFIYNKFFGLNAVRRSDKKNHVDFLIAILNKLFANNNINTESIKYIMLAHTSDFIAPLGRDCIGGVLNQFGLEKSCYFSSTAYNCAAPFLLMKLAADIFQGLISTDNILLLTCDIAFTRILKNIPGAALMSDASTCVVLSKNGSHNRYIDSEIHSYGEYAKGMWANDSVQLKFQDNYNNYLCKVITDLLEKNSISIQDVKMIFPHNVNITSWRQVAASLSIPLDIIYLNNVSKHAHGFGSDSFVNLKDAMIFSLLNPGDYYLLVSVGLGAVFSAALFQF